MVHGTVAVLEDSTMTANGSAKFEDDNDELDQLDVASIVDSHFASRPSELTSVYRKIAARRKPNQHFLTKCHIDLRTLEYMSVIGALFNDFVMNKKERFTSENMDIYVLY